MSGAYPEKRLNARVKARLKVGLPKRSSGETIDLSEGGASLRLNCDVPGPKFSIQIIFPDDKVKFKVPARLVWKNIVDGASCGCAVEFLGLKESQKSLLRKEVIKLQISPLLARLNDEETIGNIEEFFLKDVLEYMGELLRLSARICGQESYSAQTYALLNRLNNQIVLKGYCLEELVSNDRIMLEVRKCFRALAAPWIYKGRILRDAMEKPRGYPGDYLLLEEIYNNQPLSDGIGFYFDKYLLSNPYALAIRQRKDRIKGIILKELARAQDTAVKIFDVGCGSCRSIREAAGSIPKDRKVEFVGLDRDADAIGFCRQSVKGLASNITFSFLNKDIKNLISSRMPGFEKQDLIFVSGLVDFVPDRLLRKFSGFLLSMLRRGGKLILTQKNREKTFAPLAPRWFCELNFVERNKEETLKLLYSCGVKDLAVKVENDEFNEVIYFIVESR